MTGRTPVQLRRFASLLALGLAWPRISEPTAHVRLFVAVLIITVGTAAGCAAVWLAHWWIEQRS
jgi:hypothetical protein